MRRIDVGIKIGLNVLALIGVASIAGGVEWAMAAAVVSAVSALLATAILPALGWDDLVPRVHGFRGRWVDLSLMAGSFWSDLSENEKEPSKKAVEALEKSMAESDKESTWLKDDEAIKEKVEAELRVTICAQQFIGHTGIFPSWLTV